MSDSSDDLAVRAQQYAAARSLTLESQLGYGQDGTVFASTRRSAIKVFEFNRGYVTERDVYLRFAEEQILEIAGFAVPEIIDSDDELKIVEMTFVNPPYCIDFAKCYLDRPPDFSAEIMAETRASQRELFDEDQWSIVVLVMHELEKLGVYSYDARPSNIAFT